MSAGYRHDAVLYAGFDDFVAQMAPFIIDGVADDDATLVVIDKTKIEYVERSRNACVTRTRPDSTQHWIGSTPSSAETWAD